MSDELNHERLTIRVNSHTKLKLAELSEALNVSYSVLIRNIIQNFISSKEEVIDRILDEKNNKSIDVMDF